MENNCKHKNPLQRNGTSQVERICKMLDPANISIHDLQIKHWLSFASEFAKKIDFFKDNPTTSAGDWSAFFPGEIALQSKLDELLKSNNNEPHIALFIAFLKLMELGQQKMNELSKKHLDFYYKEVLQLKKKPFTPDKVHVLFELAKNASEHRLKKGTMLHAGKDNNQQILHFQTSDELIVNRVKVTDLKTVFHDKGKNLRYADISNSSDGLGATLHKENPKWSAFGHDELPQAQIGFALASPVLSLQEGKRTIRFQFELQSNTSFAVPSFSKLQSAIQVYLSGEKEWLGPFVPDSKQVEDPKSGTFITKTGDQYQMQIEISLDASQDPVASFDNDALLDSFNTQSPVAKFIFKNQPDNNSGYELYHQMMDCRLIRTSIDVLVSGMKEMTGENDLGVLDLSKPFFPFGPQPIRGSNFFIGNPEVFDKDWASINLNVEWKDIPSNFKDHYDAYRKNFRGNISAEDYKVKSDSGDDAFGGLIVSGHTHFKVNSYILDNKNWDFEGQKELFDGDSSKTIAIGATGSTSGTSGKLPSFGFSNFYKSVNYKYLTNSKNNGVVFDESKYVSIGQVELSPNKKLTPNIKKGFIKLSLTEDFLHKLYPKLYGLSLMDNGTASTLIPKEPYTPVIESITMDYEAKAEHVFELKGKSAKEILKNYNDKSIQLFHIGAHGQYEQHYFLKEQHPFLNEDQSLKQIFLLPGYPTQCTFYIGMQDAIAEQSIALLIQVAEGSENPELPTFKPNEELQWSVLCSNEWKPLNAEYILQNDTNNMLRSGILKIQLPKQVTQGNTRLNKDRVWLRVIMDKDPFTICQLLDVRAQAVSAIFENKNNDLSHLQSALPPESISKIIDRPALIKSVEQPFNSFGGRPVENDSEFYIRISERLRHKQRSITVSDFELIILQEFPSIYKVKCLNHSRFKGKQLKELSPGYVTAVVIPDLKNKNLFNRLQPRVSQNQLIEIENYIRSIKGLHVKFDAANPVYEEVKLVFNVLFRKGYDVHFYKKKLNEDIIRFLSPWAYDETATIDFGGSLHTSVLINYIDELGYVDFITDFKMYHDNGPTPKKKISASNSAAILVSAENHAINPLIPESICP